MELGAANRTPLNNVFFGFGTVMVALGGFAILFGFILGVFDEGTLVTAGSFFVPAAFFWLISYKCEPRKAASSGRREIGYPGAIILGLIICMAWRGALWFLFEFLDALGHATLKGIE